MSQLNKKGVSIMIGYVLLIAIAVSLAGAVFFYLKLYLPDERPECNVDVQLILDNVGCFHTIPTDPSSGYAVHVNLTNKGLFTVNGSFIKIGDSGRTLKYILNTDPETGFVDASHCNPQHSRPLLKPNEKFCQVYPYARGSSGTKELSIEPFVYVDNKIALCQNAVITRNVDCPQ